MKSLVYLPLLLLNLAACQSNPTTTTTANAEAPAPAPAKPATVQLASDSTETAPINTEYAEWTTLTINGTLNEKLTTNRLQSQLGRPDSVVENGVECGSRLNTSSTSDQADLWYYGKTAYEVYGSQAMLSSCDVTTKKFRGKLGQLVLDQNTTLEDVRRFYPVSAKQADVPAAGRPGEEIMSLPFYFKGKETDTALLLLFKKGRLQTVDFWSGC